ncbi:MAG TPA: hypothetical protein VM755_19820 [Stellaceae bacterium]|nr:hypothetical protein [Stellaceae bacterium]
MNRFTRRRLLSLALTAAPAAALGACAGLPTADQIQQALSDLNSLDATLNVVLGSIETIKGIPSDIVAQAQAWVQKIDGLIGNFANVVGTGSATLGWQSIVGDVAGLAGLLAPFVSGPIGLALAAASAALPAIAALFNIVAAPLAAAPSPAFLRLMAEHPMTPDEALSIIRRVAATRTLPQR